MNFKIILLVLIAYLNLNATFSQVTFQKVYPGITPVLIESEIMQVEDKGYLIGNIEELLRTDSLGQTHWMKKFTNGSFSVTFTSASSAQSGYVLVASHYLFKLNYNYNNVWIKDLTGLTGPGISAGLYTVRETPDNGFIIGGGITFSSIPDERFLLIKTDSSGVVQWSEVYDMPLRDNFAFLTLTPDHGFLLCGSSWSLINPIPLSDIVILKVDSLGNSQWSKHYAVLNTSSYGYHITSTSDGNSVLAVSRYPHELLLKIDSLGNVLWEKYYEVELNGAFRWVEETSDGGLIVAGDMEGIDSGFVGRTCLLVKTDSAGNVEWARELGGYSDIWAGCVKQTDDGGYVISVRRPDNAGNDAIGIIKTDSLGHTNGCLEGVPIVTVTNINDTVINVPVTDSIINVVSFPMTVNPPLIGSEITLCAPV